MTDWQNPVTSLLLGSLIVVLVGVNTLSAPGNHTRQSSLMADKRLEAGAGHRFCFLPPIILVVIVD